MSGNTWIILGVIAGAFSLYAIPHGFNLNANKTNFSTKVGTQSIKNNIINSPIAGDVVGGDKYVIKPVMQDSKNAIIYEKYCMDLNLFLVKFRMIIYSYYLENNNFVPEDIDKVFKISSFSKKNSGGVLVSKINTDLIDSIFNSFNFNSHTGLRFINGKSTLKLNNQLVLEMYLPSSLNIKQVDTLTGYAWLVGELTDLQKTCKDTLNQYAAVGDSSLVDDMQMLVDDIENIVKKYRHIRLPKFEKEDVQLFQFFFDRFVNSVDLCQKYREK